MSEFKNVLYVRLFNIQHSIFNMPIEYSYSIFNIHLMMMMMMMMMILMMMMVMFCQPVIAGEYLNTVVSMVIF